MADSDLTALLAPAIWLAIVIAHGLWHDRQYGWMRYDQPANTELDEFGRALAALAKASAETAEQMRRQLIPAFQEFGRAVASIGDEIIRSMFRDRGVAYPSTIPEWAFAGFMLWRVDRPLARLCLLTARRGVARAWRENYRAVVEA